MINKFDMAMQILDVCEWIVNNARLDKEGHLSIEISPVLHKIRAIVNPPGEDPEPIYTDTDSVKVLEDDRK